MADPKELITQAYELCDAAHVEEALGLVRPLLSRQRMLSHDNRLSLLRLIGRCSLEMGDYEKARQAFDSAQRIAADLDRLDLAISNYYLCRFDEAEMILDTLWDYPEVEAEICWYRGLIAERRTDFDRADSLFRRAAKLDRKRFVPPQPIEHQDVRNIYDVVIEDLPSEMRSVAVHVTLIVEELPSDETLDDSEGRYHPLILAMYAGTEPLQKGLMTPSQEDRVILFRRNIAKFIHNPQDLKRELRHSLAHEIGHHFGMDEDDLEEMGF